MTRFMTVDRGGTSDLDIFNYFFFFRFVASNFKGREMKPVEESVIQGRLLSGFFFFSTHGPSSVGLTFSVGTRRKTHRSTVLVF